MSSKASRALDASRLSFTMVWRGDAGRGRQVHPPAGGASMATLGVSWDDPELRRAPAAFRAAVGIASRNWVEGALCFLLPSGRELRIDGSAPGPEGCLIVRDFRFVSRVLASGDIGLAEG